MEAFSVEKQRIDEELRFIADVICSSVGICSDIGIKGVLLGFRWKNRDKVLQPVDTDNSKTSITYKRERIAD